MIKSSNLHKLAYALEKRADFLEEVKKWIADNPELAAGLLGGTLGAGGGALVPTEDGAGGRVRNALIGALLGGGVGAGAGYLGKDAIKSLGGVGSGKINPLNTLQGGLDLAWKRTADNMEKDLRDAHPYTPADAQPIDLDVPNQPDSTSRDMDDMAALYTNEDVIAAANDPTTPVEYIPSDAEDKKDKMYNSILSAMIRAHQQ